MAATLFSQAIQLIEDDDADLNESHPEHDRLVPVGLGGSLSLSHRNLHDVPLNAGNCSLNGSGGAGAGAGGIGSVEITLAELDDPHAPCFKEGFLHKVGDMVKSWKTRYFRLTPGRLSYAASGEAGASRLGSILLPQATLALFAGDIFPGHPYCFGITPADSDRQYILDADSAEHRREWLNALAEPIRQRLRVAPAALPVSPSSPISSASAAAASAAAAPSVREGFLVKQGATVKNWKRRYVTLTRLSLRYQAHFTDVGQLGSIPLGGGFVVAPDDDEQLVARLVGNSSSGVQSAAAAPTTSSTQQPSSSPSSSSGNAGGSSSASQQSATPFGFLLRALGSERVYHFLTNTRQDRDGWVRALQDIQRETRI
jgi:hypothetical protein